MSEETKRDIMNWKNRPERKMQARKNRIETNENGPIRVFPGEAFFPCPASPGVTG